MVDFAEVAIPVQTRVVDRSPDTPAVNVTGTHTFSFGKRLWTTGAGRAIEGAILLVAGVFLLSEISTTPTLVVQMAIVGTVLTLGGVAMLVRSIAEFRSRLAIDSQGLKARLGWSGFAVNWTDVERWNVSEHSSAHGEQPGLTLRVDKGQRALVIPNDYLDERDRREIRRVCRALAYAKEAA